MKVVALLVQPSGGDLDMAEMLAMAARFPGLIPLEPAAFPETIPLHGHGRLAALLADWRTPTASPPGKSLKELEREFLQRVLAENLGNKTAAAKALKMHRRTLQRKLSRGA